MKDRCGLEVRGIDGELGISVKEALDLQVFRRARVVAGRGGLERVILRVNVMEVPDIVDWVRQGELLVTTGYAIRNRPEAQQDLVPALAARGVAGLAIKTGRYLKRIPPAMLRAADGLNFPLIELSLDVAFGDIINPVIAEILNRQTSLLKESDELHRHLMEVALAGRDLATVAAGLRDIVGNPVFIEGTHEFSRAFDPAGTDLTLEELLAAGPAGKEAGPAIIGPSLPVRRVLQVRGRAVGEVNVPIIAGGQDLGTLRVWEWHTALGRMGLVALERTTTIAAFEIMKQQAVSEVERRYQNLFLDQMLGGDLSEQSITERAAAVGWRLPPPLAVMLFDIRPPGAPSGPHGTLDPAAGIYHLVRRLAQRAVTGAGEVVVGEKGGHLVLLCGGTPTGDGSRLVELAHLVAVGVDEKMPGSVRSVGIGRSCRAGRDLYRSYQEALRAVTIGGSLAGPGRVVHFEDLGILRLLHQIPHQEEVEAFFADTLAPLVQYDREHQTPFVETLEMFLTCHGNMRRAAERLYVHYNTVLYRLDRIQAITGINLDDPENRLNLHVALKLYRFREGRPESGPQPTR